jgi:hypothetical protein
MADITLNQMFDLASRLPRTERAELVARLVHDLAAEPLSPVTSSTAWETMERLRAEFAHLSHAEGTLADQLERDRADRQALLEGACDVHT